MKKFLLLLRGGIPNEKSPAALQNHLEQWLAWKQSISGQVLQSESIHRPVPMSLEGAASSCEKGKETQTDDLTGFLIFGAGDLEEALEVAEACPIVRFNGKAELWYINDDADEI